ncbi:MAG: hypothetical protein AAGA21_11210 [Pseudomonadota bacterium]
MLEEGLQGIAAWVTFSIARGIGLDWVFKSITSILGPGCESEKVKIFSIEKANWKRLSKEIVEIIRYDDDFRNCLQRASVNYDFFVFKEENPYDISPFFEVESNDLYYEEILELINNMNDDQRRESEIILFIYENFKPWDFIAAHSFLYKTSWVEGIYIGMSEDEILDKYDYRMFDLGYRGIVSICKEESLRYDFQDLFYKAALIIYRQKSSDEEKSEFGEKVNLFRYFRNRQDGS